MLLLFLCTVWWGRGEGHSLLNCLCFVQLLGSLWQSRRTAPSATSRSCSGTQSRTCTPPAEMKSTVWGHLWFVVGQFSPTWQHCLFSRASKEMVVLLYKLYESGEWIGVKAGIMFPILCHISLITASHCLRLGTQSLVCFQMYVTCNLNMIKDVIDACMEAFLKHLHVQCYFRLKGF